LQISSRYLSTEGSWVRIPLIHQLCWPIRSHTDYYK